MESGPKSSKHRLKASAKGESYEMKLVTLLCCRAKIKKYKFEVGKEVNRAAKFDDVVVKFKKYRKWTYKYIQAKHMENVSRKITFQNLFADHEAAEKGSFANYFNLQKYYASYEDILCDINDGANEGGVLHANGLIIFTTIGLDTNDFEKNGIEAVNVTEDMERDKILFIKDTEYYNLKVSNKNVIDVIIKGSHIHQLARKLVTHLLTQTIIRDSDDIIIKYFKYLEENVIDVDRGNLTLSFKEDFIHGENLKVNAKMFRDLFIEYGLEKASKDQLLQVLSTKTIPFQCKILQSGSKLSSCPEIKLPNQKHVSDFLKHLIWAVKQPNVDEIERVILEEMKELDRAFNNYALLMDLREHIACWAKEHNKLEGWISEQNFNAWITAVKNNKVKETNEQFLSRLKRNIVLKAENSEVKQFLASDEQKLLICTENQTFLTALKLNASINNDNKYKDKCNFVFSNLKSFKSAVDLLPNVELLIIECNKSAEKHLDELLHLIESHPRLRVIIISKKVNNFAQTFNKHIHDRVTAADLIDESRQQLFDSEVNFQGKRVKISEMISTDIFDSLDEDTLIKLALDKEIKVGQSPVKFSQVDSFYIKLYEQIYDIGQVVEAMKNIENLSIAFLFSGIKDMEQLQTKLNSIDNNLKDVIEYATEKHLIALSDELKYEDLLKLFKLICQLHSEKIVYWLQLRDGNCYLKQIYQPQLYIQRHFETKTGHYERDIDYLNSVSDQVVLLSDEPGMGKTMTFIRLTNSVKSSIKPAFVINIHLSVASEIISNLRLENTENDFEEILQFLLTVINENNSLFSSSILRHHLKSELQDTYLFFDGFDEISDNCQDKIIQIIKHLAANTEVKMWISTRPIYIEKLERGLNILAIKLKAFDQETCKQYLDNFYQATCKFFLNPQLHSEKVGSFISSVLIATKRLFRQDLYFVGVPLQLRLIAEGLRSDILKFISSDKKKQPIIETDLLQLYEKFITDKYNVYFTEKEATRNEFNKKIVAETCNKTHEYLALNLIYKSDCKAIKGLLTDYLKKKKKDDHLKATKSIGIVQSIGEDGDAYFLHRTFAEYFVAQFIFNNSTREEGKLAKTLFEHQLSHNNSTIMMFVNHLAARDMPLHMAIVKRNPTLINGLLSFGPSLDINAVDELQRSALHFSAMYNNEEATEILLVKNVNLYAVDVFKKTALHYAAIHENEIIFEKLLYRMTYSDIETFLRHPSVGNGIFDGKSKNQDINFINQLDCFDRSALQLASRVFSGSYKNVSVRIANRLLVNGAELSFCFQKAKLLENVKKNDHFDSNVFYLSCILLVKTLDEEIITFHSQNVEKCFKWSYSTVIQMLLQKSQDIQPLLAEKGLHLLCLIQNEFYEDENYLKVVQSINNNWGNPTDCLIHALKMSIQFGYVDTFKYLLNKYPTLQANIWDCLKIAIKNGHVHLFEYLWENYQGYLDDKKTENTEEFSVLHFASAEGHLQCVQTICSNQPERVHVLNKVGQSALHLASSHGHLDIVKYLISKGAQPRHADNNGDSAIHYAYMNDQSDVFAYLAINFDLNNQLPNVFIAKMWKFLNSESTMVNASDDDGVSLLHLACMRHKSSFVQLLIERGADVHCKDNDGGTPLHYAAANVDVCNAGQCQTVKHLLRSAATYVALDDQKKTLLQIMQENVSKPSKKQKRANNKHKRPSNMQPSNCFRAVKIITELYSNSWPKTFDNRPFDHDMRQSLIIDCLNLPNEAGDTPLHLAIKNKNIERMYIMLKKGANIFYKNKANETPLMLAKDMVNQVDVKNKNVLNAVEALETLFNNNFTDCNERTVLDHILKYKDIVDLVVLFTAKTFGGKTLLHFATINNWLDVAKYGFFHRYVDVDAIDNMKRSALHYATELNHVDMIHLLLENGCSYNVKDVNGKTPLDLSKAPNVLSLVTEAFKAIQSEDPLNIIQLANNSEFNFRHAVNAVDDKGHGIIYYALRCSSKDILKLLLRHGAPIESLYQLQANLKAEYKFSLTEVLCHWKHDPLNVKSESDDCQYRIISNARNALGETLLHFAGQLPLSLVEKLIVHDADVNAADKKGNTPLHKACGLKDSNLKLIDVFVQNGANINARNFEGKTPLFDIFKYHIPVLNYLLANGVDVNAISICGKTPLMIASAQTYDCNIVRTLLMFGALVNAKDCDKETALFYAVRAKKYNLANILLEYGADVNVQNISGKSPLMEAAGIHEHYKGDFVLTLVNHKASVNAKDCDGETALVYAVRYTNYTHAKHLLEHGADVAIRSKDGESLQQLLNHNCQLDDGSDFSIIQLRDLLKEFGAG